ncbi:MAG: glycosyltransferase family 2 protein [Coriobacteriales bacterium]|nr:glycosyltransferase family 2 protein [Coriobacteriales bacterium]
MPVASIVIPCYNAQKYLHDSVASAQAQTVSDIEIICVNDGSTDDTLDILRRLASEDARIHVIDQPNGGEGPARDAGLCAATGDWLYFLDADDLMEPTLLEEAIAACTQHDADVVVFRTMMLDEKTQEKRLCEFSFKRSWTEGDCFVPGENPDHLFNSFQNWVHNKVFRGSFVRENNLHMQHVHRTADLLFTCHALTLARRIALLDKPLHTYRVNNAQSAMQTSDAYPLDFYQAFLALRESLEADGTWELYHDSYVNWAIEGVCINLRCVRSFEGYSTIVHTMQEEGLRALDIVGFPRSKSDRTFYYDNVVCLEDLSSEEVLFRYASIYKVETNDAETECSRLRLERDHLRQERDYYLNDLLIPITNSASFKIGRAITSLPRKLRDLVGAELSRRRTKS